MLIFPGAKYHSCRNLVGREAPGGTLRIRKAPGGISGTRTAPGTPGTRQTPGTAGTSPAAQVSDRPTLFRSLWGRQADN